MITFADRLRMFKGGIRLATTPRVWVSPPSSQYWQSVIKQQDRRSFHERFWDTLRELRNGVLDKPRIETTLWLSNRKPALCALSRENVGTSDPTVRGLFM